MMSHERYRRALLANPLGTDPELEAHRASCEDCRAFTDRMLAFEHRLLRALKVGTPISVEVLPFRARNTVRPTKGARWLALAAGVAIAFVIGTGIWLTPRSSLAADVVAHMTEEPNAWKSRAALPAGELNPVLKRANISLDPKAPTVSYANSCEFRGHVVPHLVVQSPRGPVTVMVLTHEAVSKARHFDEQGYRGMLLPIPQHGSIAVLMRAPGTTAAEVDAVAAQVRNAIVWGS